MDRGRRGPTTPVHPTNGRQLCSRDRRASPVERLEGADNGLGPEGWRGSRPLQIAPSKIDEERLLARA